MDVLNFFRIMMNDVKRYVGQTYKTADEVELETTEKLKNRANVVFHWKAKLENAISTVMEEIELLEAERRRVKRSLSVLNIPASIAGEFLHLRSSRLESDLVRDEVEEQLTKVKSESNSPNSDDNLFLIPSRQF